ncbi:MAG: hypothetical protein LCH67_10485 [Bacteroidetes bacterium]|nr:hypothetical protein [Bacteroidota bacterium]
MPDTYFIASIKSKRSVISFEYILKLITYYLIFQVGVLILLSILVVLFGTKTLEIPFLYYFGLGNFFYFLWLIYKHRFSYQKWELVSIEFDDENEILSFGILNPYSGIILKKVLNYQNLVIHYSEIFDLEKGISKKMTLVNKYTTVNFWNISYSEWEFHKDIQGIVDRLKILAYENNRYFVENETWLRR